MANPALGTKRHCQSCDENYYDLNKTPIVCPHCQSEFDPEVLLKSRKSKPAVVASPKKVEASTEDTVDEELTSGLDADDAEVASEDDILDDDGDLGVIAPASDGDDEEIVTTDEAIEDELDAPVEEDE